MNQTIHFLKRDFTGPAMVADLDLSVEWAEWRALGGPSAAQLRARASTIGKLWQLVDLLRCGVMIYDQLGAGWWGMLVTVELHWGARVVRISLDDMANRVAVRYGLAAPAGAASGVQYTDFVTNEDSIKVYGTKEAFYTISTASYPEALAYAYTMVYKKGNPVATLGFDSAPASRAPADRGPYALLTCKGWWQSLNWKFYKEPRGKTGDEKPGTTISIGSAAAAAKWAQSFTCGTAEGWRLTEVWLRCKRILAADALFLSICDDNGGQPGTARVTGSAAAADVAEEMGWVRFGLTMEIDLAPGTTYWMVVEREGAINAGAYYQISVDQGLAYTAGVGRLWNGTGWVARTPDADLSFVGQGVEETTEMARRVMLTTGCGQFLTGARVERPSGVFGLLYRDGRTRGQAEIEALLARGTDNGLELLAKVDEDRTGRIYRIPTMSTGSVLMVGADGQITERDGRTLSMSEAPAGQWAKLGDLASAGQLLGFYGWVFINRCMWDGKVMKVME